MKVQKQLRVILLFVLVVLQTCIAVYVYAADEASLVSREQVVKGFSNRFKLRLVEYSEEEYSKRFINSLDVSPNELIAVTFSNASVVIADKDFNPVCTMKFDPGDSNSNSFQVRWISENTVAIKSQRDDFAYITTLEGKILDVVSADEEEYESIVSQVNGNTYKLMYKNKRTKLSFAGWDKLVRINERGEETVLFQSKRSPVLLQRLLISTILVLPGVIVLYEVLTRKRKRKDNTRRY